MKVVLDSNIYIAAFSSRGLCSSLFELCLDSTTTLISEHIISEVSKNLLKKIKLPANKTKDIIIYLREQCVVRDYQKLSEKVCRDADNDNILVLVRDNRVDYIITGDKDLLVLEKFDLIPIIDPRKFWSIIKNKESDSKNTMN